MSKSQIFFLDFGRRIKTNRCHTHAHTPGLKVILTCESFRRKNLKKKRNRFRNSKLWGFGQSLQNLNWRPTGDVIAKTIECHLFHSVWINLAVLARAFGRTHGHKHRLHFCLCCLFKGVSYDLLKWDKWHENQLWEKGLRKTRDIYEVVAVVYVSRTILNRSNQNL